ncbi:hypothetical protein ACXJJ3_06160 [Kribbella sp. WER1]
MRQLYNLKVQVYVEALLTIALSVFVVAVVVVFADHDPHTFWNGGMTSALWLAGAGAVAGGPPRCFITLRRRRPLGSYPPIAELLACGWTIRKIWLLDL